MTGGGNGIVLIQQNRPVNIPGGGTGQFGPHVTTGNNIHDNVIVDHDSEGYIGGVADTNQSGMLNGGNTWSDNQYFMSDEGDRFQWGGSKNFASFKSAAHETGSISQSFPNTDDWLTGTPANTNAPPPVDDSPPPADTNAPPPADTNPPLPADTNPPPAAN
jgi:hypothetical protein